MPLQSLDLTNAVRTLVSTPAAAPQLRLQVVQSAPSTAEAVFVMVSVLRLLAQEAERKFAEMIEQARRDRDRLREQMKAIDAAIEKLKRQAEKIEEVAQKMELLRKAIPAAVGTDPNCQPNRAVVAARVAELRALQAAAESSAAALDDARYRAFLEWIRRLLEQVPVLFDIPGWR
jgi:hypothetical protein